MTLPLRMQEPTSKSQPANRGAKHKHGIKEQRTQQRIEIILVEEYSDRIHSWKDEDKQSPSGDH